MAVRCESHYVVLCDREIHYRQWGEPANPKVLIMWHGFARSSGDYETVAEHFADRYRVVAPDTIGRGLSEWSPDINEYSVGFYLKLAVGLLDHLNVKQVDWIGTSMGGLIGFVGAAMALKDRIRRIILSDVGPKFADGAIQRVLAYTANPPSFKRFTEFEAFMQKAYASFGVTDPQWFRRHIVEPCARRLPNGEIVAHYDPLIIEAVREATKSAPAGGGDLWAVWDMVTCPVLVLRGEFSDLLSAEVAEEMTKRGPKAELVVVTGVGHAPNLNTPFQINLVEHFFGQQP